MKIQFFKSLATSIARLAFLLALASRLQAAPETNLYIGDAHAMGQSITSVDSSHVYGISELTIIMPGDASGIHYTAESDQQITLTEVNFLSVQSGNLTPFVALWDGVSTSAADSYTFLAIGDTIASPASTVVNASFEVDGENPTLDLSAGQTIVAGFYQVGGKVVNVIESGHANTDYVYGGNSIAAVNGEPSANSVYNYDSFVSFNIGINIPPTPEPTVTISSPTPGSIFEVCDSIQFAATVSDDEDDDSALEASLVWTSDLEDEPLGTGASFSTNRLRVGTHTISASSTDSDLDVGTDTISLTIAQWNLGAIWFIGDSITQSNADGDANGSPRKSLYDLLIANNVAFSFTGHSTANIDGLPSTGTTIASNLYQYHSGISGSVIGDNLPGRAGMTERTPGFWTTGRLATVKPNVVLIMLGTNDIDNLVDIENAPNRIKILVDTILAQVEEGDPSPAIFVAQIPPNRNSSKQQLVIDFNTALTDIVATLQTEGKDVTLVDQFSRIQENASELMRDNLHTNAAGNDVLAEQWYEALVSRFGPATTGLRSWQIKHFGTPCGLTADPSQDPDHDGQSNLLEYALGNNPHTPDLASHDLTGGVISFPKGADVHTDIRYAIEESTDLGIKDPWDEVTPSVNNDEEISYTMTSETTDFFRLKVTQAQ
ncbi:GDSL-type esterase/lipase family protein [Coraliomargarita algicola]|uniref:GDSL-type esterase/lipase family protein n=1 Tax=Coraliomargarita algicola TaxID=3092156 RepID=A0ABZ0RP36_9BACT|nr:SGNH/GDSL hydrolase family protein [Coraliomargarita sp. J2-16]WPJ96878.1 GDSL-type esterase/lipase family protein [Coraliomargarita sp. J2-16]